MRLSASRVPAPFALSIADLIVSQPRPAPEKLPAFNKPTALHDVHALLDQLRKLPKLRSEKWEVGETYTLSARKPWVEDRGYIDAFQPIMAIPEQPTFQFANHIGVSDEGRHIEIWLTRLTPGASYIVQLRLQAGTGGSGEFPVGAASVKELYSGTNVVGYAVSLRIKTGPSGDSWYWYENGFGGVGITSCTGCHSKAGSGGTYIGRDFVFVRVP